MIWWTEKRIPLLMATGFLLICRGGLIMTVILWGLYLYDGWKTIQRMPSEENNDEFCGQMGLGFVVIIAFIIFRIAASG